MRIAIKFTNMDLTEAIELEIRKKFEKLLVIVQKWVPQDAIINVEIGKETRHHWKGKIFFAEARFDFGRNNIYAHCTTDDLHKSIDECVKDCKRQFLSVKDRILSNKIKKR